MSLVENNFSERSFLISFEHLQECMLKFDLFSFKSPMFGFHLNLVSDLIHFFTKSTLHGLHGNAHLDFMSTNKAF